MLTHHSADKVSYILVRTINPDTLFDVDTFCAILKLRFHSLCDGGHLHDNR